MPYRVVAVGIDPLQQLTLKLLQGRLEGDGQSAQGEGQRLEQLRPQQSVSWWTVGTYGIVNAHQHATTLCMTVSYLELSPVEKKLNSSFLFF